MAVSVDTVYQKVLALANKEQRGYITPLEFNLLANQAQELIFEQYFYDLDQFKRRDTDETSFSDMQELIENKLTLFTDIGMVSGGTQYPTSFPVIGGAPVYRTGRVFVIDTANMASNMNYEAKHVEMNEVRNYLGSEFHMAGLEKNPIYHKSNMSGMDIEVYNHQGLVITGVTCELIVRPQRVEWGYDVIAEKALYNASRSANFQLHASEETELVFKILELAGIVINKVGLVQTAAQEDAKKIQYEKQ
jgi:hypothetical protein